MQAERRIGWRTWVRKGAFAVTDQGLVSGSNFWLSILLARWLAPEQYGAYALAFSIFFFVSAVHQALLLEPMSVFGPSEYATRQRSYIGAMLWFHGAFSILLLAGFGGAAWLASALGDPNLAAALLGLAFCAPGILLFWLARMACYVKLAPATAASGAALYCLTLVAGAWMLSRSGWISTVSVMLLMGSAATLVATFLLAWIRPDFKSAGKLLRESARRHWSYGRWALGSSLVIWVPGNIFYSLTTAFLGIGSAGAFRALMNLTFPVTHTASALSMLLQPQLSSTASNTGARSTESLVARMAMLYACGALAWLVLVALQTERVWQLLYRGRFHDTSSLAVWVLVGVVFQVTAYVPAIGLRALKAPSLVFFAYSIAAVACLAGGIPAIRIWGLAGAAASYSGSLLLSFIATIVLYRRRVRTESRQDGRPVSRRFKAFDANASLESGATSKLKILLSAYACEPNCGSEPGVGWNWAQHLAGQHELWIITRSNNRGVIEAALTSKPLPHAHFIYYDLPRWSRFWKRGSLGLRTYYYLWQIGAYFSARRLARHVRFDLVQHVTFVKYWMPSFVSLLGPPFIWGPVGGGESAPSAFRSNFSLRGKLYDAGRRLVRALGSSDPWVTLMARRAYIGLATTEQTAARMRVLGCRDVRIFSEAGLSDDDISVLTCIPPRHETPFRIVSIGNLLHLKGFDLSLQAFAGFLRRGGRGEYWLIGAGPERTRLEALARRLGVVRQVKFWGRLARAEVLALLADCDVVAHPSLHDSGGWTCLEAMAAARPVVCFDLGGPGTQVTAESGIKIPAENPNQAIAAMTIAFESLAADPMRRWLMGAAGRARVRRHFRWHDKPERLLSLCGFTSTGGTEETIIAEGALR
jgi:glycosyltransferase involved in cell wall biosynthesis